MGGGDLLPPNWSQFVPDLFNAGITGAIVALIVWRLQVRRDDKRARQAAEDDWRRLRPRLRLLIQDPIQRLPATLIYGGDPAAALTGAIEQYPIEEWARILPKDPSMSALVRLETVWPLLIEAQRRVYGQIAGALTVAMPTEPPSALNWVNLMTDVVRGRINKEDVENLPSFMSLQSSGWSPQAVSQWVDAAMSVPELQEWAAALEKRFTVASASMQLVRDRVFEDPLFT